MRTLSKLGLPSAVALMACAGFAAGAEADHGAVDNLTVWYELDTAVTFD